MSRLEVIKAQHAEHDMSDSDEFYLLGQVTELESALRSIVRAADSDIHGSLDCAIADARALLAKVTTVDGAERG